MEAFQGASPDPAQWLLAITDHQGHYIFKTIKPAGYGEGTFGRTPHIHFKVNGGGYDELVTQMYFAGEPQNKKDIILSNSERAEQLIIKFNPISNGKKLGNFDIILG